MSTTDSYLTRLRQPASRLVGGQGLVAVTALVIVALMLAGCETADKSDGAKDSSGDLSEGGGRDSGGRGDDSGAKASSNRVTVTNSYSNNPLTSQTINSNKAASLAQKFDGKDERTLEGRVSAARLARKGLGEVMGAAKKLAEAEMEKGAARTISDDVKLELALAALDSKNFALAEYYLQVLTDSRDAKVRAGAFNAMGVVALRDDRVPEAVLYFRQALKAVGNYRPALLNLGFTALMGGDLKTAKQTLSDMSSDWFVQSALISIERIEGDTGKAGELCDRVLSKESGHKAALFNCGLLEFQNKKNYNKAKELFAKSSKSRGGEPGWDNKANAMLADVSREEQREKQAEARKKAAAAAADAAKEGGNSSGAPQAPQGGQN